MKIYVDTITGGSADVAPCGSYVSVPSELHSAANDPVDIVD